MAEAFEQAAHALTAIITLAEVKPQVPVEVKCEALDIELLFVEWLNATPEALKPGGPAASLISIGNHRRSLRSGPSQACDCSPGKPAVRMAAFGELCCITFSRPRTFQYEHRRCVASATEDPPHTSGYGPRECGCDLASFNGAAP